MSNVILAFGMCLVVMIDNGNLFKSVFVNICTLLDITCWCFSRGSHKGNSVKRYHRFLNKTQAIAGNDCGTHKVYLQNTKKSQYVWNSAPIDNADVTCTMAAIGRNFRFLLDVKLSPTPTLNTEANNSIFQYFRNVSTDSTFSLGIL